MKDCRFQYDDGDFRRGCNCECHQKRSDVQAMHGVMPHPECQHCDREVPPHRPRSDADPVEPPQEPCSDCQWRIELDRRGKYYLQAPRNHGRLVAFMAWFACGVRDYSSVEACHILQSLGLYQCSRVFETCRMDGQLIFEFGGPGRGPAALKKPDDDWYRDRPVELDDTCFYDLVAGHGRHGGRDDDYRARDGPWLVPIVKTYHRPSPRQPGYTEWCKQQLLLFRPWRSEEGLLEGIAAPEDGSHVDGLRFVTSLEPCWCEDGSYPWVRALEWWVHSV